MVVTSPLKKARVVPLPPSSESVGARGVRLRRGRRVKVMMWDGTVVRGFVSLAFGDGSCDVTTAASTLESVEPNSVWFDNDDAPVSTKKSNAGRLPAAAVVEEAMASSNQHEEEEDADQSDDDSMEVDSSDEEAGEEGEEEYDEDEDDAEEEEEADDEDDDDDAEEEEEEEEDADEEMEEEAVKEETTTGPKLSFAQQMMAQLAQLKAKSSAQAAEDDEKKQQALYDDLLLPDAPEENLPKYVPNMVELPCSLRAQLSKTPLKVAPKIKGSFVEVERLEAVESARRLLPACAMETEIVELVRSNDVVVISGETGCGKSTQIPQFLYEAGFAQRLKIGVTQPRRVATVATALRVRYELNAQDKKDGSKTVAFRTRYASDGVGAGTEILFETDGVLLQEARKDLLLREYSAIVIDEAHERSLNTDLLLGMLCRAVPLRRRASEEPGSTTPPLKLIIMSATWAAAEEEGGEDDPLRHFRPRPPVLKINARQFPVTVHFSRVTPLGDAYVEEALRKVRQIDAGLPAGGILVFLTGKKEIEDFCKKLRQEAPNDDVSSGEEDEEVKERKRKRPDAVTPQVKESKLEVVPLYASMPLKQQKRAIAPSTSGKRFVVVATNVAETSLTIPGVKYVVDSGRTKRRVRGGDGSSMAAIRYEVGWISRASAEQRAGRAGRTAAGHVYRLYSTAVYSETLEARDKAEMESVPLEDVVLHAKALGVRNVANFPFPTSPPPIAIKEANRTLARLGALDSALDSAELSENGKALAQLPVGARQAATLLACGREKLDAKTTVALVASLSEMSPFLSQQTWRHPLGDAHSRLAALGAFAQFPNDVDLEETCRGAGLDPEILKRTAKLYGALAKSLSRTHHLKKQLSAGASNLSSMQPPSGAAETSIARCVAAGLVDRVARRAEPAMVEACLRKKNDTESKPLSRYERECCYELMGGSSSDDPGSRLAYLSGNSALYSRKANELPAWIVYSQVLERGDDDDEELDLTTGFRQRKRRLLEGCTAINGAWLASLCPAFVKLDPETLAVPAPKFDSDLDCVVAFRKATFNNASPGWWDLPLIRAALTQNDDKKDNSNAFAWLLAKGDVIPGLAASKCPLLTDFHHKKKGGASKSALALLNALDGRRTKATLQAALQDGSFKTNLKAALARFR